MTVGNLVLAQDRFPDPIPMSGLNVEVEQVAIIPDSSANLPARISVLTEHPSGRIFANDQRGFEI